MGAHGLGVGVQLGMRLPEGGAVAGLLRDRGSVTHLADGSMTVRCVRPPPAQGVVQMTGAAHTAPYLPVAPVAPFSCARHHRPISTKVCIISQPGLTPVGDSRMCRGISVDV